MQHYPSLQKLRCWHLLKRVESISKVKITVLKFGVPPVRRLIETATPFNSLESFEVTGGFVQLTILFLVIHRKLSFASEMALNCHPFG